MEFGLFAADLSIYIHPFPSITYGGIKFNEIKTSLNYHNEAGSQHFCVISDGLKINK